MQHSSWMTHVGVAFALLATTACSGKVEQLSSSGSGGNPDLGSGGIGTGGGSSSGGSGGIPVTGGSTSAGGSGGSMDGTGGEPYMEPECPDEPSPDPLIECDPKDPGGTCGEGEGCYPFVNHPFGQKCDYQLFGAVCVTVGSGQQNDFCGEGTDGCAAGYMCVLGSAGGKRCAQFCPLEGESGCPEGLFCGPTDVRGWGVCY